MELSYLPLLKADPERLCRISHLIFKDYITGPYVMQPHEAEHILQSEYVDPLLSTIVQVNGHDAGYILISTDNNRARVASMGFIPEARGIGIGRTVLTQFKSKLREKGFQTLELEVFEQNKQAVALYESMGFRPLRRLLGFKGKADTRQIDIELLPISFQTAADIFEEFNNLELPWQISAWRIRQLEGRNLAWSYRNDAILVTSKPQTSEIVLTTLIVRPTLRRQGLGRKVVCSLQHQFSDLNLKVPQLCPEEASGFFHSLGFTALDLNQIQMRAIINT